MLLIVVALILSVCFEKQHHCLSVFVYISLNALSLYVCIEHLFVCVSLSAVIIMNKFNVCNTVEYLHLSTLFLPSIIHSLSPTFSHAQTHPFSPPPPPLSLRI